MKIEWLEEFLARLHDGESCGHKFTGIRKTHKSYYHVCVCGAEVGLQFALLCRASVTASAGVRRPCPNSEVDDGR